MKPHENTRYNELTTNQEADSLLHTEPAVTRRDVLSTALTVSLMSAVQGLAEGSTSMDDTDESLQSESPFPQWTAYDAKLSRYISQMEIDDPDFSLEDSSIAKIPKEAPIRRSGLSATRTQSTLRYLGTTYAKQGDPDSEDSSTSNGAWRHTFALSSVAIGIKPLFLINKSRKPDFPYVPKKPIYGPAGEEQWDSLPLYDIIQSQYIEGKDTKPYRTRYVSDGRYWDVLSKDELTSEEVNFSPSVLGPDNKIQTNDETVKTSTKVEISSSGSSGKGIFSSDNTAISARRDNDLFSFSSGTKLIKSMMTPTGIDLLQQYGPYSESSSFNIQRRLSSTPFSSFEKLEDGLWWENFLPRLWGFTSSSIGLGLAIIGIPFIVGGGTLTTIGGGLVLAVVGFSLAASSLLNSIGNPPELLAPSRGFYHEHPNNFGPGSNDIVPGGGDPASGVSLIFDVYSSPEEDGVATIRAEHPIENRTNLKSIWFVHLPKLPAKPEDLDENDINPPRLLGPGHDQWVAAQDHLIPFLKPKNSSSDEEGINKAHKIDLKRQRDLVRTPPRVSFSLNWESRKTLSESVSEIDYQFDIEIPELGSDFVKVWETLQTGYKEVMEPLQNAIEEVRNQSPSTGEPVTFDPSGTQLGGAPMVEYKWKLYRKVADHSGPPGAERKIQKPIDDSNTRGKSLFRGSDGGAITHTFSEPGKYEMHLIIRDGRDADNYSDANPDSPFQESSRQIAEFEVKPSEEEFPKADWNISVDLRADQKSKKVGEPFRISALATSESTPRSRAVVSRSENESGRFEYKWSIRSHSTTRIRANMGNPIPKFRNLQGNPYDPVRTITFYSGSINETNQKSGYSYPGGPGKYDVFVRATDVITGNTAVDSITVKVTEDGSTEAKFYDSFEDGNYDRGEDAWEILNRSDMGNFQATVVERDQTTPNGGTHALRISETTGGGTIGQIKWQNYRKGWSNPWRLTGLFFTEKVPLNYAHQSHVISIVDPAYIDNPQSYGQKVGMTLGFTNPTKQLKIDGESIDSVSQTYTLNWEHETWYYYELQHDGEGAYTGRIWPADEDRPQQPQIKSMGSVLEDTERLASIGINGAHGEQFNIDHAFMKWQTTGSAGGSKLNWHFLSDGANILDEEHGSNQTPELIMEHDGSSGISRPGHYSTIEPSSPFSVTFENLSYTRNNDNNNFYVGIGTSESIRLVEGGKSYVYAITESVGQVFGEQPVNLDWSQPHTLRFDITAEKELVFSADGEELARTSSTLSDTAYHPVIVAHDDSDTRAKERYEVENVRLEVMGQSSSQKE